MPEPAPQEQIQFLINIQRLLDEGLFVASYKFALLLALADLSIETGDNSGDPLSLSSRMRIPSDENHHSEVKKIIVPR
jgi:hypothetical protein